MPTLDEVSRQAAPLLRDLLVQHRERQAKSVPVVAAPAHVATTGRSRKDAAA